MKIFDQKKRLPAGRQGFTLIELMVSVAIFTIVMVLALGSLLSISAAERKAEALKSVMNNLNFALESMSRSIRTGVNYSCMGAGDCVNGGTTLSFLDSNKLPVYYKFETSDRTLCQQPTGTVGCIARSLDSGANYFPITAPEVVISNFTFYVTGVTVGDKVQPKVNITLSGSVSIGANTPTAFNVQTSVTQRIYDQ